jgi:hypothetical protein
VNGNKIKQYCMLLNILPSIARGNWQWNNWDWWWIIKSDQYDWRRAGLLYIPWSSYIINENCPKANAYPLRAFSNTFIQPTTSRTKLNSLQNINLTPTNEINITPNNGSGTVLDI